MIQVFGLYLFCSFKPVIFVIDDEDIIIVEFTGFCFDHKRFNTSEFLLGDIKYLGYRIDDGQSLIGKFSVCINDLEEPDKSDNFLFLCQCLVDLLTKAENSYGVPYRGKFIFLLFLILFVG